MPNAVINALVSAIRSLVTVTTGHAMTVAPYLTKQRDSIAMQAPLQITTVSYGHIQLHVVPTSFLPCLNLASAGRSSDHAVPLSSLRDVPERRKSLRLPIKKTPISYVRGV